MDCISVQGVCVCGGGIICLAKGNNTLPTVGFKPPTFWSGVC